MALATAGVSTLTAPKYFSWSMRTLERFILEVEYQPPSSWRISLRITSSRVRALPDIVIRLT